MRTERKVNFSDIIHRAILMEELSQAKGWHNVSIGPARVKASNEQHGYYRAVLVPLAKAWLNETQGGDDDGEDYDEDGAHTWLKNHLRGKPVIDPPTGEYLGMAAASHAIYTSGMMTEYIEDVVKLLTSCGVRVPPADRNYREHELTT